MKLLTCSILLLVAALSKGDYTDPHWTTGKSVMIHMMDWRWQDIAKECEDFLAPNG